MIDHLVYAVSDLETGINHLHALLGVRAAIGGSHPGWGTRNALLSLGSRIYLEIIAPDPEQIVSKRPLGVDREDLPRLTTWAMASTDLDERVREARVAGFDLGSVQEMSRVRPDGTKLAWRLTDPFADRAGGLLPFLIDWGDSPHPAETAPIGCHLLDFYLRHPEPETVIEFPDMKVQVQPGAPGISALLSTPKGEVWL